tara:strand:- start:857 stop:1912 length:1056 start_codon:yes stop_codon:yes gene_type:complete
MKLLITGGCGFIGSNFILSRLKSFQDDIILNYDSLTYSGNPDNLVEVEKGSNYNFVKGDICDSETLKSAMYKFEPDIIIHFAAESHVDRSIDNPFKFVNSNVLGTVNLLTESFNYYKSYKHKLKNFKFIHISTDEVFGSLGESGSFDESSNFSPNSPYSASKASSDHFVRSWHKTYGLPTIITNCSNNYGPFQFPEKLIPLIIANCLDHKPLPIYGKGDNIRDWLFVSDHCEALSTVIDKGRIGNNYNIGGNNEIKNIEIVNKICSILDNLRPRSSGSYQDLITFVKDRPGHDYRYAVDSSKISNELNWSPKESFESGILKTIQWYLDNEHWWRKIQKRIYNQERLGLNIN